MSLLPNEVKTEHIANRAVTTPKIADEAVATVKIKDGAVKTKKLATGAVTHSKIGRGQITGSRLRDATVRSEKIANGAIITAKIGPAQVIGSRIKDKTITSEKLARNAVTTAKIANGAITQAKLSFTLPEPGGDGITRPITPAVTAEEIAPGAVTEEKLATDSVTQTKIARNTVGWSEIREQSLEPEQIKTLSGEPPTDGQVPVYDASAELDPVNPTYWWFRWETPVVPVVIRPITPPIATDEIADAAVTPEKASAGFGRYVPRLVTGADFTLTLDYTWREIDLSGIVPAGATGVILRVERVGTKDSESVIITADRIAYAATSIRLRPAPKPDEVVIDTNTLPILADRILDYYGDEDMSAWVAVLGWFI